MTMKMMMIMVIILMLDDDNDQKSSTTPAVGHEMWAREEQRSAYSREEGGSLAMNCNATTLSFFGPA